MSEEWGPLITISVILGNAFPAILAAWFWVGGHIAWLVVNGKNPSWMQNSLDLPVPSSKPTIRQYKPYHIYLYKGIAWGINILWACAQLFIVSRGDASRYKPIIGDVTLLDLGGISSELIMFFVLISLYRWFTREKRK